MNDFKLDGRKWKFLDNPEKYPTESSDLIVEPLKRQFKTAKEILDRFKNGRGVLLADDVGLGKTTIGALVAWVIVLQKDEDDNFCNRVRIYAPNEVLRRRWAEELERHVPMLERLGASVDRIKQGDVGKLHAGRIQVATHHALVKSHGNKEQRTACDLMIIDEAHRAKGDGSAFNEALRNLGDRAKRKLILTATPFSIHLDELKQLLQFAGATKLEAVRRYACELKRIYTLGDGHDVTAESRRLVGAAKEAIEELQPYLIRCGIDDLSASERKHFGMVDEKPWDIPTAPATQEDLALLLRMDRILQLTSERKGERRNDPRFHIGWQHVGVELERADARAGDSDPVVHQHIEEAKSNLVARCNKPHPKVEAVSAAIRTVINDGEKVLVFCRHHATASELLSELEGSLKRTFASPIGPEEKVWRAAWESLLPNENDGTLVQPIIDWLCTPGLRAQIGSWLGLKKEQLSKLTDKELEEQLKATRPRNTSAEGVPTIAVSAQRLRQVLLDPQSTSTRTVLARIGGSRSKKVGGKEVGASHFPGDLDNGYRVMGFWSRNEEDNSRTPALHTLYTAQADLLLALFNSPFGPDVLVTTDKLSEGVDLHRCCRHLIHYELDPSPVRTIQRNGRIRRVGSLAALTNLPIRYAYPTFGGTRDEKSVVVMRQRISAFGLLLGGVPPLDDDASDSEQSFAEEVLCVARKEIESLNRKLCVNPSNADCVSGR